MIYTYKCEKCNTEVDVITTIANKDNHKCEECGEPLKQLDTAYAASIQFKGRLRHY